MSKSGLFGHFGSKEDLQLATTIDAAQRRFVQAVVEPALARSPGGRRALRALCERLHRLPRGPRVCRAGASGARHRPSSTDDPGRSGTGSGSGLARGSTSSSVRPRIAGADDPRQLAFELQALGQGANSSFQLFGDPAAFKRARRAMTSLLP